MHRKRFTQALIAMMLSLRARGESKDALVEAKAAVGDLTSLSSTEKAAFEVDPNFFSRIHKPGLYDWQTVNPEPPQSFADYAEQLDDFRPKSQDQRLCVLPLGDFKGAHAPALARLSQFCACYFSRRTELLGAIPLDQVPATRRFNKISKNRQILTTEILEWLDGKKPNDVYAVIAVTMEDLYPSDDWNFVFGEANLIGGTGVFSFARHDPSFFGQRHDENTAHLIFQRSLKVLIHEMGHMFGMDHCAYLECNMNGSNNLEESDRAPLHLCPVCLRKLHAVTGLDLLEREKKLHSFYTTNRFQAEAEWTQRRILKLEGAALR